MRAGARTAGTRGDRGIICSGHTGDVFPAGYLPLALGIERLELGARVADGRITASAEARGKRLGTITARVALGLASDDLRAAPLDATLEAQMPSIAWLAPLAGPSIALEGALRASLSAHGSPRSPRISGSVAGDGLALRDAAQGVDLADGSLRAELRDTIKAENSAFLRSLSDDLDFAVGEDRRDLFDLGRTIPPAMLHAPHAAYTYLTSQVGMLRIFDGGISLYSVTGAVVTDTQAGDHHSPAERAALQAVLASSDSQTCEPFNVAGDDPRIALFVPNQSGDNLAAVLEGVWRLKGDNAIVSIPHM